MARPDFLSRLAGFRERTLPWRAKLKRVFDLEASGRLIVYSALVGAAAGLFAALFYTGLEWVEHYALDEAAGYHQPGAGTEGPSTAIQLPTRRLAIVLMPALGGLVCGFLVYRFAPEAEGHGTDAMVRAFHRLRGVVRGRIPLVKGLASIATIGTGGSAGREGPVAQIGAGFGSAVASFAKMSDFERRYLMLAGAAGGLGAIFRAPLGAALFVGEVLYGSTAMEFGALVPAVFASVLGYTVFATIFGQGFAFTPPRPFHFSGFHELPLYFGLAIVCAIVGYLYVTCFYGLRDHFFHKLPLPKMFVPAVGGLLLGLLALGLPQIMGGGYGWIQQALDGKLTMRFMALLVGAKIVATSLTISSGGSGGVFAPSLFIGAMLGGAYGTCCHDWFPDWAPEPGAYVLVGMGGFFAGVAKVPLTALLMVSEMSGSYELIVPLMLVSTVNMAILSSRVTLYEEQVLSPIDSPAHLGDFAIDVLARLRVREVYTADRRFELIPHDLPLVKILPIVAASSNSYFPVIDSAERLVGIFSLNDIRAVLMGNGAGDLVIADDLMAFPVLTVTLDDDLHKALRRFTQRNLDELPIVDQQEPTRVIGMLRRHDVIAAYDHQLQMLRQRDVAAEAPEAAKEGLATDTDLAYLGARDQPTDERPGEEPDSCHAV